MHLLVVIVLQPAVRMAVVVMMVIMAVVMIMIVIMIVADLEKLRLDLQNAVEIERAALQHILELHLAALGAMQLCVRVDAADARLDFGELRLR